MVPAIFTLLRLCPRTFAPASYLLPLSLSLCYFRPISLPRPPPRGAIHILGIQKGKGESNKREKRKEKDGGNLPTSRIALISHPCEIASAAHPSRRLTATLSLLLPPPLSSFNLAPYYLRLLRLPPLAPSFLQNWTARWNSQFATSILRLSPPLSLSLSLRERGLSQTHPLLENARFLSRILFHRGRNLGQTRARREEKKGRRRSVVSERSSNDP